MSRLAKLQRTLGRGQALLLGSLGAFDANTYYYFGYEDFGAFLVTRDGTHAFTREPFDAANWTKMDCFTRKQLPAFLKENKIRTLLFDEQSSIAPAALKLAGKARLEAFGSKLSEMRLVKEPGETALMRKAQSLTKACVATCLERGAYGKTDNQLAGELEKEARERGAALNSFEPIVLVNEEARKPHGEPSGRRIKRGDLVLIDVGATFKRYHGDYSTTFYEGRDERIRDALSATAEAKRAAERLAKPGATGKRLEEAALAVLEERGFGKESFKAAGLSLGHHIGLQVHEGKRFADTRLARGMAFTIEPGVYAQAFGVRFEDIKFL
ncbi:MAG: Xaa-Pro peptidase family protein [Candidatus Micrarchaeia archaeon]